MTKTMMRTKTQRLVLCGMIAALYATVTFALAPISFGMVQVRVAEALTLLPALDPLMIAGVSVGCLLSNILGFMTGANILGWMDILFGTAATLLAALMSYRLRKIRMGGLPVLSALPPVLVNGVIIGLELTYLLSGQWNLEIFLLNAASVAAGQMISCFALGLPLIYVLQKSKLDQKLFRC